MAVAPSYQDFVDVGQAEAQSRRPDLKFRDGDVSEAFCHAGAAMADAVVGYAFQAIADTYFGLASGAELDTVIMDKTGLPRKLAETAKGTVHLVRAGAGASGTLQDGAAIVTDFDASGKQVVVVLSQAVVVPAGAFSLFVAAEAMEPGSGGKVRAGALIRWQDQPFDASITVTNDTESDGVTPADFDGGNEAESDDDYRLRGVRAWLTQRRGTLEAIEQGALSVGSVASAIATEDYDSGIVAVSVADQDGNSNQAMIATVMGLGIAIPLLFINAGLVALSKTVVHVLEEESSELLGRKLRQS